METVVDREKLDIPHNAVIGSKEISIRRKELVNSHLPVAVRNEAITKISSVFGQGIAPLRGLTDKEEKKWLPEIIGVSVTDPGWQKAVTAFWADLSIKVNSNGIVLQIGFTDYGDPISLMDYIHYRFCLAHPQVALDKPTMESNPNLKFYIHDPTVEARRENVDVTVKKKAYIEFAKISGDNADNEKMKRIIRLISDSNPDNYNNIELENLIATIIDQTPEKFFKVATDKRLDVKATIHKLVEYDILRKIGNTYIYLDATIGNSMDETIIFLSKTENSSIVAELKAKLKEAERK